MREEGWKLQIVKRRQRAFKITGLTSSGRCRDCLLGIRARVPLHANNEPALAAKSPLHNVVRVTKPF
jgi:hypothetical protein